MAARTDVTIDWVSSPRVLLVAAPSTEITVQEVVDTCRAFENRPEAMDDPQLIDAAGKEPLGGGVEVGITATLQNTVLQFEARSGPSWELCKITGGNLVAVDDVGAELDPRLESAYTSVDRALSSSATTANLSSLNFATYQNGVTVKLSSSYSGTEFPVGTPQQPVNNWSDAISIAVANGLLSFYLVEDTAVIGVDLSNYIICGKTGIHEPTATLQVAGTTLTGTRFDSLTIEGTIVGTGDNEFSNCILNGVDNINGHVHDSNFTGTCTIMADKDIHTYNCFAGSELGSPPVLDFVNSTAGQTVVLQNFSGYVQISNMANASDALNGALDPGWVIFGSTCTAGTATLIGTGTVTDGSNGTTVGSDNMVEPRMIHELWKLMGLDISNPMTVTKTSRNVDTIEQTISGDGENTSTVTRTA